MKSTGMVRKIDELGRLVIPAEIRQNMGIQLKDPVEIFVEEDKVIIKKYEPSCIFCGGSEDVILFRDKRVCKKCMRALAQEGI